MKYLCLAYGDEKDWNVLTKSEQDALLVQDEVLRKRGDVVAAVQATVTTVRAWDGTPTTTEGAFAGSRVPLAGFCIIEAADLKEVVQLVARTPCARASGVEGYLSVGGLDVREPPDWGKGDAA
jgi:hypothetical protein